MPESSNIPNDGEIITAVLNGRVERFSVIVTRYQGALLRMAQERLGSSDWAEDVVQESFLCAFKSLHSYDSQFSFRTWLWTIVLNQCRRHVKRRSRKPAVHTWSDAAAGSTHVVSDTVAGDDAAPPSQLIAHERNEQLREFLARLPEAQADALRLRYFGELKFHEIADVMGCSLSTAKNRVRWGLTKLSEMLVAGESK